MRDWNKNGEYDMEDAFIDYHIHRSISGKNSNDNSEPTDWNAVFTVIGIGLLILGIIILFV